MRGSIAHREQYYRAEDRYCTWGMLEAWNLVALHSDPDARSESLVSPLWLYALLHRHQDGKANIAPHTDSIICEPLMVVMVKLFMAFRASQLVDVHRIGAKSDERQCSVPLGNLLSLHGTLQGPLASICVRADVALCAVPGMPAGGTDGVVAVPGEVPVCAITREVEANRAAAANRIGFMEGTLHITDASQ